MRIGNYKTESNEYMPYWTIEYLHDRVENLANYLEKKLGDDYEIFFEQSRQSEACYLTIQHYESGYAHETSFRNHRAGQSYDTVKWLSHYDTWTDIKKEFLQEDLPKILTGLKGLKERDAA